MIKHYKQLSILKKYWLIFIGLHIISLQVLLAQGRVVTGRVTSAEDSQGLPGTNILIKGTTTGTVSDADGNYSIDIPSDDAVLVFTSIGYAPQEVAVGSRAVLNVAMVADITSLDEIVVIGYGTQKKADITGAVATFDTEQLQERPLARVDQALVGQMAGVQVRQTSGAPGKAFSIQVRGAGSISAGNEPLYVIDGFPLATASPNSDGNFSAGNPLDNLNPNDIESIQVLKDASAAAIYGSRASNGVVLITTKRGKAGKPQIAFNMYTGFTKPNRELDVLSGEEWIERAMEVINGNWVASGAGRTAAQTSEERRVILGLPEGQVNSNLMIDDRWLQPGYPGLNLIDWQKEAFRSAPVQNYQLSASGANDFARYYISANYADQDGFVLGMGYKTYSVRANVEVNATEKLKFGINVSPSYSIREDPGVEGKDNILHQLSTMTPVQEASFGLYPNAFDNGQYRWSVSPNSPIAKLEERIGETRLFRTLTTAYLDYTFIKGLSFRSTINFDNGDNASKSYVPYTVSGSLTSRQTNKTANTSGSYRGFRTQTFVNENTVSFNRRIANVHNVSVLAGTSYNQYKLDNVNLTSSGGFNSGFITTLNAATGISGPGSSNTTESKSVLLSYFGRAQYDFNDKYLVSLSLRRDGSSRFGTNTKWGWFPSASIGWRISSESFMSQVPVISGLKVRASWGKSGNNNIGDYSSIPTLGFANYTFGDAQATGQGPNRVANADLGWERSETYNIGLDLGVLENRITASVDYYTKRNTDLLLNVPVPQITGFPTALTNIGEVKNKGWEVEVTSRNLTGELKWTTSVNFSNNSNKVVSLGEGATSIQIPSSFDIPHSILQVGKPMYSIYVVKQIGILSQEEIDNGAALYGSQEAGDPQYFDYSKDGVIDADDRMIVGKPNPDYIWGITNTFHYEGFDLSFLIQGQQGGYIYSLFGRAIDRTGMGYLENTLALHNDRWRSPEDPGAGIKGKARSNFGRIKNTDWLYSSDYWRVRNITLGYDLGRIVKVKPIQGARIYVTAENWFGHDKYKGGYNPEATNTNLSGSSVFPEAGDYGGLPLPKSLIVGLNLTF